MRRNHTDDIHRINYLRSELDALYHQASLRLGLSDSVSVVLYTVYDAGGECLLSTIYKTSGISKQTVNSALRRLEADGILSLSRYDGRAKKAALTEKGQDFAARTVGRLFRAEAAAFDTWTDEEAAAYLRCMEKYLSDFRRETEKL